MPNRAAVPAHAAGTGQGRRPPGRRTSSAAGTTSPLRIPPNQNWPAYAPRVISSVASSTWREPFDQSSVGDQQRQCAERGEESDADGPGLRNLHEQVEDAVRTGAGDRPPGRAGSAGAAVSARDHGPRTGRTGRRCSRPHQRRATTPAAPEPATSPPASRMPNIPHAATSSRERAEDPRSPDQPRRRVRLGQDVEEPLRLLEVGDQQRPGDRGEHPGEHRRHHTDRGLVAPVAEHHEQRGDQHQPGGDRLGDQVARHLGLPGHLVARRVRGPRRRHPMPECSAINGVIVGWSGVVSAQIIPSPAIIVRVGSSDA